MTVFVLDANVLYGDFYFQRSSLRVLADSKKQSDVVALPEVVLDEIANQFREHVSLEALHARNACLALTKLRVSDHVCPVVDVVAAERVYREEVAARIRELGLVRLPYPTVEHRDLVARDLRRLKPFTPKGKGYRDALLWECVVRLLRDGSDVVLVSNNTDDFGYPLHPDFVADLRQRGLEGARIVLEKTIDAVVENHMKAALGTADEFADALSKSVHPKFDLWSWLRDNARTLLSERWIDPRSVGFSSDHHEVEPLDIRSVAKPTVIDVKKLPTGSFVVTAEALITAEFEAVFIDPGATYVPEPPVRRHLDEELDESEVFVESTWAEVLVRFSLVVEAEGKVNSSQRLALIETDNREFPGDPDAPPEDYVPPPRRLMR